MPAVDDSTFPHDTPHGDEGATAKAEPNDTKVAQKSRAGSGDSDDDGRMVAIARRRCNDRLGAIRIK